MIAIIQRVIAIILKNNSVVEVLPFFSISGPAVDDLVLPVAFLRGDEATSNAIDVKNCTTRIERCHSSSLSALQGILEAHGKERKVQ